MREPWYDISMNITNPVDADLVHDVDLILSNDPVIYNMVREACAESVENDDLSTNDVTRAYAAAHGHGNDDWYGFVECAALRVVDVVQDLIEAQTKPGDFVYDLLTQRLDLGNKHAWACITEKFMPEPSED